MEPSSPVTELEEQDVELRCSAVEGNPTELIKVAWYKNGDLIKEQPEPGVCPDGARVSASPSLSAIWSQPLEESHQVGRQTVNYLIMRSG